MSFDEFGGALQAGELAEAVVIRPEEELNSSSLLDEAVREDAKKALNERSRSEILKNPSGPFYPVIREYQVVVSDPAKVKAIVEWPVPRNQKDVRQWLGLANYLHKYSENYAEMARPLSNLLKEDAEWRWNAEHQHAFEAIKDSLLHAPILALPGPDDLFGVVCDARTSPSAVHCYTKGRERAIAFESRHLKAAEKNYRVHDKELLAMKYALVKFRIYCSVLSRL
ncbi:unnamed protein product [Phytophthora fragariaefolia]|uniref:Unnamed protein product n=1 Tax=Phytophthora fragariaefolia TaxID=1490495 RepID=A0A9W7CZQ9_9STRA|nr:unnamed protein product [Phytophthora fragariaefolia]